MLDVNYLNGTCCNYAFRGHLVTHTHSLLPLIDAEHWCGGKVEKDD